MGYNKVVRVAVIADIHSNLEALEAVLEDAKSAEETWCLGDVVGYGPNPNECCEIVKKKAKYCIAGNHDWGVLGKAELSWFNVFAVEAIKITRRIIEEKNKKFLENLPKIKKLREIVLVHGSVKNPIYEYIFRDDEARDAFKNFSEKICFVGHTHRPATFKKNSRRIINPGAVGQPRDGDPRASYGLFDDQKLTFEFRRVAYPIEKTQEKMKKLGLPRFLIERLTLGR